MAVHRIEGFVIVSADGMIADATGHMPDSIKNDADQKFFQDSLDSAAVLLHGRHSHEGGPRADKRRRLVLTRKIKGIAPDPAHPQSLLWNPAGATLDEALQAVGAPDGVIAIIGGTDVFGMFLPHYDAFHLSHAETQDLAADGQRFRRLARIARPRICSSATGSSRARGAISTRPQASA